MFIHLIPESSPVARGGEIAGVTQCLECHGQNNKSSMRDWDLNCHSSTRSAKHPEYTGDCNDLLAYFSSYAIWSSVAERSQAAPNNRLLLGEKLARQNYCFECHGDLGQGGTLNSGALKGYIPGYFGYDFHYLTSGGSREGVHAWLTKATNPNITSRFIEGPIANYYFQRQSIQMPLFAHLPNRQLELLIDYLLTIHAFGPMDAKALKEYDALTRLPHYQNKDQQKIRKKYSR